MFLVYSITKTRLYNFDPLKPHFYTVKLGFAGVYIIFLISAQKHKLCGYSLEPPRQDGGPVPVLVLLFVALWFILRGDLFYVLPCVILFLCFTVLLALQLPRLGKRELILVLFVRLYDLCLFGFVDFRFLLVFGKGCGL